MKIELLEAKYSSNSVFVDSATGKQYIFDPSTKKFKLKPNSNSDGGSGGSSQDQNKNPNKDDSNKGKDSEGEGKDKSKSSDPTNKDKNKNSDSSNADPSDSNSSGGPGDDDSPFKRSKKDSNQSSNNIRKPQIGDRPQDQESKDILDREAKERAENNDDAERSEEENIERIDRVKKMLADEETASDIDYETEKKVQGSRQQKREIERKKQLRKFQNADNIEGFVVSINNFIKNEVAKTRVHTYSKLNKTYNANTGSIIRQGTRTQKSGHIPRINVYFDQSASWSEEDIRVGESAIAVLNQYVKKKQIVIDVYKFANRVGTLDEYVGGGTAGEPVMRHIRETRPDNVIVMTDSDIDDIKSPVTVNGGVWILWKNGYVSENLKQNLHGKKLTKYFNIKGIN